MEKVTISIISICLVVVVLALVFGLYIFFYKQNYKYKKLLFKQLYNPSDLDIELWDYLELYYNSEEEFRIWSELDLNKRKELMINALFEKNIDKDDDV